MSSSAILLSIRPQYANKIFQGIKTVELRRVRPKHIQKGVLVLMYVSSPMQSLAGAFKVDQIVEEPLSELWKRVHDKAGVTREEFDAYYDGVASGVGIFFTEVWPFPEPIKLQDLQKQITGFQPPQGFRYATKNELTSPQIAKVMEDTQPIIQSSFCFSTNSNLISENF